MSKVSCFRNKQCVDRALVSSSRTPLSVLLNRCQSDASCRCLTKHQATCQHIHTHY